MEILFHGRMPISPWETLQCCFEQGHVVVGSDSGIYPPMSTVLQQAGIRMYDGFFDSNLRDAQPDLVVVGNAISRGNRKSNGFLRAGHSP